MTKEKIRKMDWLIENATFLGSTWVDEVRNDGYQTSLGVLYNIQYVNGIARDVICYGR